VSRSFIEILTEYLKDNNLTQSQFARAIGAKPSLVNDWLRGKAKPSYDNICAIAKAYDGEIEYFLGLKD
jgi:transcriptional regulator with XRE-family HTH domain